MTEPEPAYNANGDNPFSPYLSTSEVKFVHKKMMALFEQSRYGEIVLVWHDGKLAIVRTAVTEKPGK